MPTGPSARSDERRRTLEQGRFELVDLGLLLGETRATGLDLRAELIEELADRVEVAE